MEINNAQVLGQARPANGTAVSIYGPADRTKALIFGINIANTTSSSATYRLFIDEDGTTYDQSTALAYDVSIAANNQVLLEYRDGLPIENPGNLAIRVGTNSALTFTAYGSEVSL